MGPRGQPPRLADKAKIERIKEACANGRVTISNPTQRFLALRLIGRDIAIKAILRHISENRKIHVKPYPTGGQGYHGSLCIDPVDTTSIYFEIKIRDDPINPSKSEIWMQLHEHNTGHTPLER